MRKLTVKALGRTVRVLNKSGAVENIKGIIMANNGEISNENALNMAIDVLCGVCTDKCYGETIELLAYLFETTPEEMEEMELSELKKGLAVIAKENNLSDFFTQAFMSASQK